jgi:spoIIIJ-associated protein
VKDGIEASGATVEEAIDRALEQLGAREDEVEVQIVSEGGARGLLGRKMEPAVVFVSRRDEHSPGEPAGQSQPVDPEQADALLDDQADAAEDFLNGLLDVLDMDGEAQAEIEDDSIFVDVEGPDMGLLIGRHGVTLEALQELVRAAVQHQTESRVRIVLDIDGYRKRQRALLERKVRGIAAKVRKDRRPVTLDPMTPYERMVVHTALSGFSGVITTSQGDEPDRRIVIRPA